jgi:uncharacterized protein YraI
MKRIITLLFAAIALTLSACTISVSPQIKETPTITPIPFLTATLAPTLTPRPSATPIPPTPVPTIEPVIGFATTQINVRAGPDKTQSALGTLNNLDQVEIIGKDAGGGWYLILYAPSPTGLGWIASAFIRIQGDATRIPVVDQNATTLSPTQGSTAAPTSAPFTATSAVKTGIVQQKINVRSGPGSNYNSLGILNPGDTVTLTGRNETSSWLQIQYPGGPDDRGWVSAAYVQVTTVEGLPYYNNLGTPIGNIPTLVVEPATPTPTLVPAPQDGDSAQSPAVSLTFQPTGARLFTYSSDVSSPTGDAEDWIEIRIDGPAGQTKTLLISLACTGNGSAQAILQKNGSAFTGSGAITCGMQNQSVTLNTQETYLVRISAIDSGSLQYTSYTITIQSQ